jgi:hypothetical protein
MNSIVAARWADLTVEKKLVERAQHVMKISAAFSYPCAAPAPAPVLAAAAFSSPCAARLSFF